MADFKFGAKLKLFGEHDVTIRPNREFPGRVEYHDETGIAITREKLIAKLNIKNENIQKMIPQSTRITDLVFDRNTTEFEIGVVVEPGKDFVLNKYEDIITIDEVSLFYKYDPAAKGEATVEEGDSNEELPASEDDSEGVFADIENTVEGVVDDVADAADDMMDDVVDAGDDMMEDMEDDLEGLG
ncbi:MAG: hypothetical protein ACPG19_05135 [Saprospiraceae bacterium]